MHIEYYHESHKNNIIEFLKKIAIDEFGFSEWENYLDTKDFSPYNKDGSIFLIRFDNNNNINATCGMLKVDEETVKLNSFYIDKEHRNLGIGSYIYNMVLNFAKTKGYKKIILCTYDEFDIATSFYKNRGFKIYKEENNGEKWLEKEI